MSGGGRSARRRAAERVPERGPQHREAVAAAARGAGEVDDERGAGHAGEAAREQPVRRLASSPRGSPRRSPARAGRAPERGLRRHVARPEAGAARREHDVRRRRPGRGSLPRSPRARRDDAAHDLVALLRQERPGRRRYWSSRSPSETPSETVRTAAFTRRPPSSSRAEVLDDHLRVERLDHVVDGQRGHRDGRQRLHLDSRLRSSRRSPRSHAALLDLEARLDVRQRQRVAQRDDVGGVLRRHDAGERAVAMTSPLGRSPRRSGVPGLMRTNARARARRRAAGLAPTSTMRTAPLSSTWLRSSPCTPEA